MEEPRREAGAMQHRPEAIARPAEVLLHRRRVQAGIDPAEEDFQIGRDDVRQRLAGGGEDLLFGRHAH
jgi:hypothetical protein